MLELLTPVQDAVAVLQSDIQKDFIRNEERRAAMDGSFSFHWPDLKRTGEDHSQPLPVTFTWRDTEELEVSEKGCFFLLISEARDLHGCWTYATDDSRHDVYNLKAGTRYYWCVQRNGKRSTVRSFRTSPDLPRCLKIDSVSNVRDLGGYATEGGRIRQGLVYRGGEFELHMHLTPGGMEELRRLSIRTELDMRGEARGQVDFTTAELAGIHRVYVPSVAYDEVFNEEQRASLRGLFEVFTDPARYPVYFHCWGGADRTGTLAFILGAFLGMSLDDLICEYEFTTLSIWGSRSRNYLGFQRFMMRFMALSGDSLREKATVFLKEYADLTDGELATVYRILIEDAE